MALYSNFRLVLEVLADRILEENIDLIIAIDTQFNRLNTDIMPIKVSDEGWVRVPPPKITRKPTKPVDPVNIFRGPLAYITGRPEFKESAKKQSIKEMMLQAASIPAPPPPPEKLVIEDKPARSHRSQIRVSSAPVSVRGLTKPRKGIYEDADEEIPRPDLYREETQSRRSASPVGSRAAPPISSRRHVSKSQSIYQEEQEDNHRRPGRKHQSSRTTYHDDNDEDHRHYHLSNRSERSYRDRNRDDYHYHSQHNYPPHHAPAVQPIVIYSTPPPISGCNNHHHNCFYYHLRPLHYLARWFVCTLLL